MSSVTWAIGSAQYSKLSHEYSAFRLNFTRALLALPLFILAVFLTSGGIAGGIESYETLRPFHFGWLFISVVSSYGLGDAFFLWSTLSLGIPGTLAIASSYPIFNALYAAVFEGNTLSALQWCGLFIAIGGIITVILSPSAVTESKPRTSRTPDPNSLITRFSANRSLGILFAFITAVAWAMNSIAVAKAGRELDPSVGNSVRMAIAVVLTLVFARSMTGEKLKPLPSIVLKRLWPIFILESFIGVYFFMIGLSRSNLVIASILSSLAPVLSVPVTVALRIERFSWKRTLGVFIVVIGLAALSLGG